MTQRVTKPIALDRSFNTTESTPRNIADVLAENLLAIKEAIENGADTGGAFIVSYGSTTAQQIYDAIREDKVPYLYYNGVVAQLWKVETNKYTFRTTETRVVDSQTYLDIIDYSVTGVTWDTDTKTISGGSGGQTPYFAKASSVSPFDTTGKSGSQEVVYIDDVPEDGIYQVSVLMGITPQIAAASKSDLVFSIVSNSSVRLNNSFHAIVDDSELFAQQVSFSISLTLKAGRNALVLECDDLTTSYLVSVDIMTIASLVNGSSSGGGGSDAQFVLVRSNMTTDFTNQEYQDCVDAVTAEKAVCVQFGRNDRTFQAQLTQVESDTGLLVFEIDVANIHITYEVSGTNNSHAITESDYQNGTPIFDTLQTAISWNVVLHNGDIFETNGFHTNGDGGAARYKVSSTGTANGMDIVQLSAGKLAILQVDREAFVEQIGYEPKNNAADASDLTPYIQRLFAMNVYRIRFKATYLYYYMKTPLEINKHDAEFVGGLDTFSGYSSRIEYVPNNDVVEDYCFKLNARRIKFKHLYINDNPTRTHICFKTDNPSGNHEGFVFDGLNVSLFDIAFSLCGSVNWQHTFNRVRFNQCRIGLYTQNTFFMNNLTECYFSCLEKDVFSESEYNAVTFMNCNFECLNQCVHFSYWKQDPELANKLFTLTDAKFTCCSFEFHTPQDVPSNVHGCFIYVDDFVQAKLNLDTQNLSLKKLADTNPAVTDTTCFSFGENTYCTFVSVRGQDYTSYWASKFLWDNTRHPAKDIGAITIVNSYNIPRPSFGDLYLPTFRGNDGVIYFSNATNILVNYPSLKEGDKLFNLDDGCYYTKSADQLVKVSNSPNNFVRIGDELYNYVVIGDKKWITRNIRLQTTNSKVLFKKETGLKEEWGLYYPFGDRAELSAKLPTGWRIPTKTDLDDLISSLPGSNGSEKAHNAQSTLYPSVFPDSTNSSGLNIPPSQQYEGTSYVRGYFMSNTGKYTLVVNANGILEYDITPDYPNLISPIRVCADV